MLWSVVPREKESKNKIMEKTFIFEKTGASKCIGPISLVESNHHLGADAERQVPTGNTRVKSPTSCSWGQLASLYGFCSKPPVTYENAYPRDFKIMPPLKIITNFNI